MLRQRYIATHTVDQEKVNQPVHLDSRKLDKMRTPVIVGIVVMVVVKLLCWGRIIRVYSSKSNSS